MKQWRSVRLGWYSLSKDLTFDRGWIVAERYNTLRYKLAIISGRTVIRSKVKWREKKKGKNTRIFPVVYDAGIFNDTSRDISPLENVFTSGMTRTIVADSHIRRRRRRRLVSTRIIAVLTSWLSYRTISDRSVTRDDPSLQYYWFAWRISIPVSFFRPTINFANVSSVMLCPRTEMLAICKCISLSPSPVSRNELRVLRN